MEPAFPQPGLKASQIPVDGRRHVGVEHRRREALVLAVFGHYLRGEANENTGHRFPQGGGDGALAEAVGSLQRATDWILTNGMPGAGAGATPYLELFGIVVGGYLMARSASIADARLAEDISEASFYRAKIATAEFYATNVLPKASGLERAATSGAESLIAMAEDAL